MDTPSHKLEPVTDERSLVVLIGYQDQGNLGLGYLAAVLKGQGYEVDMIDVRGNAAEIAERLLRRPPLVVGYSLIFQCYLPQFRSLARYLRRVGVWAHFTVGGHFASLCPEELLAHFPELDSIVLYEGEHTLADLVNRLSGNRDWRTTVGIAYRDGDTLKKTAPRELVQDLDTLPFPYRPFAPEKIGAFATLPLLASRGCVRRCSFCSIHQFYRNAPGKAVRVRRPEKVVEEMLQLHHDRRIRIFLFQDDDFPLWSARGKRWADEFAHRLHASGLSENCVWKISCRAEYVDLDVFSKLRNAGLFLVYLGLESGNEEGLATLNKEMTPEQNLLAVEKLKQLDILANYGFMLFDPSSSFDSIRRNIDFLRRIFGDGHSAAAFARMLPYGGTPIRESLRHEGRLRGDITNPDYDFRDLRINDYYRQLSNVTGPWLDKQGLSCILNYAWYEFAVVKRLVPDISNVDAYHNALRSLTAESNERLFGLVENSSLAFESGDRQIFDLVSAQSYCETGKSRLMDIRNTFVGENIGALKQASDCNGNHSKQPMSGKVATA